MRQFSKNRSSRRDDHSVCDLSPVICSGGSILALLHSIAKFHSYTPPTIVPSPVQINSQMTESLFNRPRTVSPVSCYSKIYSLAWILWRYRIWPIHPLYTFMTQGRPQRYHCVKCSNFSVLAAFRLSIERVHITGLHLQNLSLNEQLESRFLPRVLLEWVPTTWHYQETHISSTTVLI